MNGLERLCCNCAAYSGNLQSLKTILTIYPEAERLRAVNVQDDDGWIALCSSIGQL